MSEHAVKLFPFFVCSMWTLRQLMLKCIHNFCLNIRYCICTYCAIEQSCHVIK